VTVAYRSAVCFVVLVATLVFLAIVWDDGGCEPEAGQRTDQQSDE